MPQRQVTQVQADSVEALRDIDDRFVRWQVDPAGIGAVWRRGNALVLSQTLDHHGAPVLGPTLLAMGGADEVRPLLEAAAAQIGVPPLRLTINGQAREALPSWWQYAEPPRVWDWMWTDEQPPRQPGEESVTALPDDAGSRRDINGLLDLANPASHGRPGEQRTLAWVGVRDVQGRLVATGVVTRLAGGAAHLRGVATLPAMRGRGLGAAVSARLSRIGLAACGGRCSLGVYSDNTSAIRIYRRLGYRHLHTFVSGTVELSGK
ncbi:MAG: GNAT family N-acetyltransferase [Nocardioidaceae bacterium]